MVREYMLEYRYAHMLPLQDMAQKCKVSVYTLEHLEQDDMYVTHPNIVKRVGKAYGLTKEQQITMLPLNYRPGKNYDPNKYVVKDPLAFSIRRSEQ